MKNKAIYLLLVLVLLGCAKKPVQHKLLDSMRELDRDYVPAFVFTYLHKQRESELAFENLKRKWDRFNKKYYILELKYGLNIRDKFWKSDFRRIDGLMISAEVFIEQENLTGAHEKLQGVRLVFKNLRHRHGIDYFLDQMTGFHEPLEDIFSYLRGKDRLGTGDLRELRAFFKEAQANLAAAESDEVNFGFDEEKNAAVRKRVKKEQRLLAAFAAALSSGNADRVFQAAQELKPNFIVLYKAFGDFQPIFDRVLAERKEKESKDKKEEEDDKKNS